MSHHCRLGRTDGISLTKFSGSQHTSHTDDDKGNGENLSHIEWQACLKGFLYLLGVFDEEAEGKDIGEAETEEPACTYL